MAELIWDGKYDEHGNKRAPVRIELPFQTVETVNESVQERQRTLELSSSGHDPEWRNRLIWGDKKYVLPSLLPEFAGKVDLIYIDPPFDTSQDFSFLATLPNQSGDDDSIFTKEPSLVEQKAYRDTWGVSKEDRDRGVGKIDRYIKWFYESTSLLHDTLSERGSIYVHLDWHVSHYAKPVLDQVFGPDAFLNEIVWQRTGAHNDPRRFGNVAESIFYYAKTPSYKWNTQYTPYGDDYVQERFRSVEEGTGRRYWLNTLTAPAHGRPPKPATFFGKKRMPPPGTMWRFTQNKILDLEKQNRIVTTESGMPYIKQYLDESPGRPLQSLWTDVPMSKSGFERTGYATQKPEALLERIVKTSSDEGDLVLDCFCGSGTAAAVAEKLNRRWIACDLGRFAIHTTRKRLLGIPDVKPFIVQNLGKYERQQWQVAEFPSNGEDRLEEQKEREANYRKFILELYHATPVSGHAWLHGVKSGRMVHVAAVDAPVTRADVNAIAAEVWKAAGKGANSPQKPAVDVLGWEFALEINETAREVAAQARVDAAFKKIPREVLEKKAVEQGDVHFFELGALSVDTKIKKRELTLTLSDFVIPLDDVPAEVRSAIKHWSQMVDYWAVDWDFKEDTFHNQWQSYRTRKNPKLELSVKREYLESGHYTVVVKVIDILGNDTTKTLSVEIK
jgi:adenine-specific DNA-methyltransferase